MKPRQKQRNKINSTRANHGQKPGVHRKKARLKTGPKK